MISERTREAPFALGAGRPQPAAHEAHPVESPVVELDIGLSCSTPAVRPGPQGAAPSACRRTVTGKEGGRSPPPICGHAYSISISGSWLRIFAKSTSAPGIAAVRAAGPVIALLWITRHVGVAVIRLRGWMSRVR